MESTLSLTYAALAGEVGFFLGFGRGAAFGDPAWNSQSQSTIDYIVQSGLRQFYFPPPLENETSSYNWSFLKPMYTATVPQGAITLLLPDDFGGMEGQSILSTPGTAIQWFPVDFTGIGSVYKAAAEQPTTTGRPRMACVEPLKGTGATQGQRFQMRVWPITDQAYTMQFQYYLNPEVLNGSYPYAYGGTPHTETILESCLAIAEQRLDDASTVHSMKFRERLAASVNMDRRQKPQLLGYNGDRSDRRYDNRMRTYGENLISVKGTIY